MAFILKKYDEILAKADPLCENYPLVNSPFLVFSIIGLYLVVVWQGPKWMKPYKPLDLRYVLFVYNCGLVALSVYISYATVNYIVKNGGYSVFFDSVDSTRQDENREYINKRMNAFVAWLFFISKLIEFMDTVFFIIRKKNEQLTFLHVYHHAAMAVFTYLGLKFLPGGANIIYPLINSWVHAIMYTYYGLSALGPSVKKYLWWKKYLTLIQISQFVVYFIQDIINIMYNNSLPAVFAIPAYLYNISILVLFVKFYAMSYSEEQAKKVQNGAVKQIGTSETGGVIANGKSKKLE